MQRTRFSQKLSNLELWCPLTTYRKLCNWAFQRTHYWIPKIQDGWDLPSRKSTWRHFFCQQWSDLDKILQTGAEWHVDCNDMVKLETRCRIPIWRTFGRIQWHVIPQPHCRVLPLGEFTVTIREPHATLQGAATWRIQCRDSRATCRIMGCCHLVNSLSQFQSHIPHCRLQSPATLQGVIIPSTIFKIVFRQILVLFF